MGLQTILEMHEAERGGEMGEPRKALHQQRPYVALASSYAKVGDATRAVSILKVLQEKQVPIDHEVHRVRLDAHLKTSQPRRSTAEIESALYDFLASQKGDRETPWISEGMSQDLDAVLGERYTDVLQQFGLEKEDVVPDLPSFDQVQLWRKKVLYQAVINRRSGIGAVQPRSGEESFFRDRIEARKGPKLGDVAQGFRKLDGKGPDGLKEWMVLPKPVRYG